MKRILTCFVDFMLVSIPKLLMGIRMFSAWQPLYILFPDAHSAPAFYLHEKQTPFFMTTSQRSQKRTQGRHVIAPVFRQGTIGTASLQGKRIPEDGEMLGAGRVQETDS